ncbi:MAG: UbiA family prenyltransferase [bacterium]
MSRIGFAAALRPLHWAKNLLVFAAAFFSGRAADPHSMIASAAAFALFCAAASGMYLVNDVADSAADAAHPLKRRRPLASGRAGARSYLLAGCALEAAALAAAFAFRAELGLCLAAYAALMTAYSLLLKKIPLVNLMTIAAGMLLRVCAGAAAVGVAPSPWVFPCVALLAMYIAAGKRLFDSGRGPAPPETLLFAALGLATFASYLVYSASLENVHKYDSRLLTVTSLPVLAGLARYFTLARTPERRREHMETAAADPFLLPAAALWLLLFWAIIYRR